MLHRLPDGFGPASRTSSRRRSRATRDACCCSTCRMRSARGGANLRSVCGCSGCARTERRRPRHVSRAVFLLLLGTSVGNVLALVQRADGGGPASRERRRVPLDRDLGALPADPGRRRNHASSSSPIPVDHRRRRPHPPTSRAWRHTARRRERRTPASDTSARTATMSRELVRVIRRAPLHARDRAVRLHRPRQRRVRRRARAAPPVARGAHRGTGALSQRRARSRAARLRRGRPAVSGRRHHAPHLGHGGAGQRGADRIDRRAR